jgi:hypothetical protein
MMDDWLVAAVTEMEAEEMIDSIEGKYFSPIGFYMADDKRNFGQQMTYLGILIDSVNMTMRFDQVQAESVRRLLQRCQTDIMKGVLVPMSTIQHICGKLNWYSEIIQSGRLYIRSWWNYLRHGNQIYPSTRNRLLVDTQWWIDVLQSWESGSSSGFEYPIISASEMLQNPKAVYILQSDASGSDGFGYFGGYLYEEETSFSSKRWNPDIHVIRGSSHVDELIALLDFLLSNTSLNEAILLWVSDSQAAVYSVIKGNCTNEGGYEILRQIFQICDSRKIQLAALWVPREQNTVADYLSHLAVYLNRDAVSGGNADLASFIEQDTRKQPTEET